MRRLTSLALLLIAATALPSSAAPVSVGRLASLRFVVAGSEGSELRVELTISRTDLGDRLELGVSRCFSDGTCAASTYYAGAVPAGALQLDGSAAHGSLRTVLRGQALTASWAPAPEGSMTVGVPHESGTGLNTAFALHRDDSAVARLSLGGRACTGPGYVGDAVQVAVGDSGQAARPLRSVWLPSGAVSCSVPEPLV